MSPFSIPANFTRITLNLFGERGRAWLNDLPNLIAACEQRWSIRVGPPFNLTYNYVAPAVRADGRRVVFKAGVADGALTDEMLTLQFWAGRGATELLDCDPAMGVMLLERLDPGTPLVTLADDEAATRIFAQVSSQIALPPPSEHSFDSINDWAAGLSRLRKHYQGGTGPLSKPLVERAEVLFSDLLASQAPPVLLHGDLHHWNILAAGRQPWLAIDPKGIIGEPCYEVGAWLRNPLPGLFEKPEPERLLARRIDILTEMLGYDRQHILGWGLAQAVLSAWWDIEDQGVAWEGWHSTRRVAEILA